MSYTRIKKVPTADEIIAAAPLNSADEASIAQHRREIEDILAGRDERLLVITGPCSAWPDTAVLEYARRLRNVQRTVVDTVKLVMRVYTQKPRTIRGWLGPINQADPFAAPDITEGALYCRKMMVEVVKMGIPIADEALFTRNAHGFEELMSWMAIGARSVEDQEHRIFASALDCPVGMKNTTDGSLERAVHAMVAAQHPHHTVVDGYQVETAGNQYAHLVLRGGARGTNFDAAHVSAAGDLMKKHAVAHPAIIIDASHDNCKVGDTKVPLRQAEVVHEVLALRKKDPLYAALVKGVMIESFLHEGAQKLESHDHTTINRDGLSITDPCIGWDTTEELLTHIAR